MNYCKKHNQKFMDHLSVCPICLGERIVDFTQPNAHEVFEKAYNELKKEFENDKISE